MTDRIRTLTVALDRDMRDDDVESVTKAISMIKYVSTVTTGEPVDMRDWSARIAVGSEWSRKLYDLIGEMNSIKRD